MHPLLDLAEKQKLHHDDFGRALNAARVNKATAKDKSRKIADGGGLYLHVTPRGVGGKCRRLWRYRYRLNGRENLYAIGSASDFSLGEARQIHRAARWLVERGIHPAHHAKEERARQEEEVARGKANTFTAVCQKWLDRDETKLAPITMKQRERELNKNVLPVLGKKKIGDIRKPELTDLLQKLDAKTPEVARNIRHYLNGIFAYAEDAGLVNGSPVPGPKALKPRRQTPHAALSPEKAGEFLRAVETGKMSDQTRIALQLLTLTAVRKQELLAARWEEFDLEKGEWSIPAGRMKMRDAHWVPLSRQSVKLLRELRKLSPRELLFPNRREPKRPMAGNSMNAVLGRLGYLEETKPHGLRSLFSTYANSVGWNPDVIEKCLAHKHKDAIRAKYNRYEYQREQREIMQAWADQLDRWHSGKGADVVPIKSVKSLAPN